MSLSQSVNIFTNGCDQVAWLPVALRSETSEFFVHQNPEASDVILSCRPPSWDCFFKDLLDAEVPPDFLDDSDRNQGRQNRDPLEGLGD